MTMPGGLLDPTQMLQQQLQQGTLGPERASFGARVEGATKRVLGNAGRALRDSVTVDPSGYEGLLSQADVESTKLNPIEGLLNWAVGGETRRERLDNLVARRMTAEQLQQARALDAQKHAEAQRLQQVRAEIAQRFAEPAGESQAARQLRLQDMFGAYVAAGDTEMAQRMSEVVKALGPVRESTTAPPKLDQVDAGNNIHLVNPTTGETVRTIPKAQSPGQQTQDAQTRASVTNARLNLQNQLAAAFERNPAIKNAREISRAISTARSSLAQNTAIADLNSIVSLTKIFDPGSVAREGEVNLTISAASLPQRLQVLIQQVNSGQKLTPAQRRDMEALIAEIEESTANLVAPVQAQFGGRVRQANEGPGGLLFPLDSALVAPDPMAGMRAPGAGLLRIPVPGGNRIGRLAPRTP